MSPSGHPWNEKLEEPVRTSGPMALATISFVTFKESKYNKNHLIMTTMMEALE